MSQARTLAIELAAEIELAAPALIPITTRRFFGGEAIWAHGVQFGFIMKGALYFRVDDDGQAAMRAMGAVPFAYSAGSRTVTVNSYYEVPAEIIEDREALSDWALRAYQSALVHQPKARRRVDQAEQPRRA